MACKSIAKQRDFFVDKNNTTRGAFMFCLHAQLLQNRTFVTVANVNKT